MLFVTDQSIWPAEAASEEPARRRSAGVLADLLWVVGLFAVAGAAAGVVWWKVAKPASYTRTSDNAVMFQGELGQRVQSDGWFLVIGLVAGILVGVVLIQWRRRNPLLVVLVGYAASLGAAALMLWLGRTLGHQDVAALLRKAAVGDHIPDSLNVISRLVVVAWPIGFLIGSVVMIWGTKSGSRDVEQSSNRA
jgi:hypothetical protein